MKVSYHNYSRMHEFLRPFIRDELEVLLSLDSDSELFEYQFKTEKILGRMLGDGYAVGLSSGTAALQLCLTGLGVGLGDEVLTVPLTYVATVLAVSNCGARPVFVDVCEDTMLMDADDIEHRLTKNSRVVLPVHLFGQMVDMAAMTRIGKSHALNIVEDACQAHGASFRGNAPGTFSAAACYSFFINKGLGGIGNGGMVLTKRRSLAKSLHVLRNPEADDALVLSSRRTPAYLDFVQLAFLKAKMQHFHDWIKKRREFAHRYNEALSNLLLTLPMEQKHAFHTYRDYAVRADKRSRLQRFLAGKGVETVVHYATPVHLMRVFGHLDYRAGDFPVAENICRTVLSLPINPFLSDEEVGCVISSVKSFFR
ncbi:MAG: DegT/DnrJ/EryC1/StrS family aminotransferase [Candidatus Woesearchaeota archaeon]